MIRLFAELFGHYLTLRPPIRRARSARPTWPIRPQPSVLCSPSSVFRFLRFLRCFAANPYVRLRRLQHSVCNGRQRAPSALRIFISI